MGDVWGGMYAIVPIVSGNEHSYTISYLPLHVRHFKKDARAAQKWII